MLVVPVLQTIIFGYAIQLKVEHIPTVVYDLDGRRSARELLEAFRNTRTFTIVDRVFDDESFERAMTSGRAKVGVRVPPDYSDDLLSGRQAQVQVLIDGSDSNVATTALNSANLLGAALSSRISRGFAETLPAVPARNSAGHVAMPIEIRPQVLYNPAMRSPNFFVPGVIGVVLQIATTFATAMSIVRERERGTLEQLLVSPLSRWGLMLGKITPYMIIGMAMASGLFAIMSFVFDVRIAGSMTALYTATVLYIFSLLSLGLLVSTRAQNQIQALQMSMIFIMPSVFFSGFIFPRETMPWIFQAIGLGLPTTYFIELMRAIILRGASLEEFWFHLAMLSGMGLALFALCALRFKKKIA